MVHFKLILKVKPDIFSWIINISAESSVATVSRPAGWLIGSVLNLLARSRLLAETEFVGKWARGGAAGLEAPRSGPAAARGADAPAQVRVGARSAGLWSSRPPDSCAGGAAQPCDHQ